MIAYGICHSVIHGVGIYKYGGHMFRTGLEPSRILRAVSASWATGEN